MRVSPESRIRVRISSEDAGSISLTPVVTREVPLRELVGWIVSVTGKDPPRIVEILMRGSFVKSLSRIRWTPVEAAEAVAVLISELPDNLPTRPLDLNAVREVVVEVGTRRLAIAGEEARRRRWFRQQSFLESLLASTEIPQPSYERYDYEERADRYRLVIPALASPAFETVVASLASRSLRNALRASVPTALVLLAPRD